MIPKGQLRRIVMFLSIENIGKVKKADIEINGITIIAGENDTGKSTISKVLYCVFNSFSEAEKQSLKERKAAMNKILNEFSSEIIDVPSWLLEGLADKDPSDELVDNAKKYIEEPGLIVQYVYQLLWHNGDNFDDEVFDSRTTEIKDRVLEVLQVSDDILLKRALYKKLASEFNSQITNLFSEKEGKIEIVIRGEQSNIEIVAGSKAVELDKKFDLATEVIYIDDPFVLDTDSVVKNFLIDHRKNLLEKIYVHNANDNLISEILADKKIEEIINKLDIVCPGEIRVKGSRAMNYFVDGAVKSINVKSLSAGLKTFAIIKTLLENGTIEYRGTIILDEPEIHLHPAWQLIFAEIIVLLQKKFNLHILLNTHSPYFLRAVEVYAEKHEITSKCKYYIMHNEENVAVSRDVTEDVEQIYKLLAEPFQTLEDVLWEDERYTEN